MPKTQAMATVGTSAVALDGGSAIDGVEVYNAAATTIYIGFDANVTTATGRPIPPATGVYIGGSGFRVFGIAQVANSDVRVIRESD